MIRTSGICFISILATVAAASPASAQDTGPNDVTVSGSVRPRYETVSDPLRAGASGTEDLFSIRTTLEIDGRLGDFDFSVEGLDSRRIAGDDNPDGAASGQLNAAELLQAYVAWSPEDVFRAGDELAVKAGRFTIDLGARRLAARSSFSSVPTAFEGVDASWKTAWGLTVRAFTVSPLAREPDDDVSLLDNEAAADRRQGDLRLTTGWLSAPLPGGITGEVGIYRLEEEDGPGSAMRDRRLATWSARLLRDPAPSRLDFDIEYARQTGDLRASSSATDTTDLSKDAHMLHAEAGYTLPSGHAHASLHYDFASGDGAPSDASDERFDPLFGDRAFELGPTGMFGAVARTNMNSLAVRVDVTPEGPWDGMLSLRTIRLDSATDSLASSGLRGTSGSHAGEQIEWRVRRWLVDDSVRLAVGGALYLRGDFLKTVAGAPSGDPLYSYADITWTF